MFYSLTKTSSILLAYFMAEELREHNISAVCLTPGWLRSEVMLESGEVQVEKSESVFFIGCAVVALASDPNVMDKSGCAYEAAYLAHEYGFTDEGGVQPQYYRKGAYFKDGEFTCPHP